MVARLVRDSKTVGMRIIEKGGSFKYKDLSIDEIKSNVNEIENIELVDGKIKVIHGNVNSYSKVDINTNKCLTKQKSVTVLFEDYVSIGRYIVADADGCISNKDLYELSVLYKLSNAYIDKEKGVIIGKNHNIQVQMTDKQLEAEKYKRRCALIGMSNLKIDAKNSNGAVVLRKMRDDVENYIVPDFITCIGEKCFESNKSLKSVSIDKSVNIIEADAFRKTNIRELVIPDAVEVIGEDICEECFNLERVVIGSGVTEIPDYAFSICEKLKDVTIKGELRSMQNSFPGCESLESIEFSCELLKEFSFSECDNLRRISIKNLKYIGPSCFTYCLKLEEVDMGNEVESLGRNAFKSCESLKSIKLSESLTDIGGRCFNGCKSLEKIRIPKGVRRLGSSCFSGCKNLKHVELNDELKVIGSYCFNKCESLESITIPKSVKEIGVCAFTDCKSLKHIKLPYGLDIDSCILSLNIERY